MYMYIRSARESSRSLWFIGDETRDRVKIESGIYKKGRASEKNGLTSGGAADFFFFFKDFKESERESDRFLGDNAKSRATRLSLTRLKMGYQLRGMTRGERELRVIWLFQDLATRGSSTSEEWGLFFFLPLKGLMIRESFEKVFAFIKTIWLLFNRFRRSLCVIDKPYSYTYKNMYYEFSIGIHVLFSGSSANIDSPITRREAHE